MKRNLLIALCLLPAATLATQAYGQDFRQQFERFKTDAENTYRQFRDSVNHAYADYLAQAWKAFEPAPPVPQPRKPKPATPPQPLPDENDLPEVTMPIDHDPVEPYQPDPTPWFDRLPLPADPYPETLPEPVTVDFFGLPRMMSVAYDYTPTYLITGHEQVAQYWRELSESPYMDLIYTLMAAKEKYRLNEWGLYQLLSNTADACFSPAESNPKTVFRVFMLNQIGYKSRIAQSGNRMVPIVAFKNMLYNRSYLPFDQANYFIMGNDVGPDMPEFYTYDLDYALATATINLYSAEPQRIALNETERTLHFDDSLYAVSYNKYLIDFYNTFPLTELSVYSNTPMSKTTLKSFNETLSPLVKERSKPEAAGMLLEFVQVAFDYKTDDDQFGYEKFFFAEELVHYPFSDCEDRAVLYAHLVRYLLGLEVVLLEYPDHVATAVHFDTHVPGDHIVLDGRRYVVCDPTYIGAKTGSTMPRYRNVTANVILLNSFSEKDVTNP